MYENRNYLIIPVAQISKIDFNQVCETSAETVRKSIDETKTFIKWDDQEPSFINDLEDTEGPYTYEEIMVILSTEEWTGNGSSTLT